MTIAVAGMPRGLPNRGHAPSSTAVFSLALAIAGALHLLLLLGVSFKLPEPASGRITTRPLEVVVLRQAAPSDEKPEIADAYAQVDRVGGGLSEVPESVVEPEPIPEPEPVKPPPAPTLMEQFQSLPPPTSVSQPMEQVAPPPPEPIDRYALTAPLETTLEVQVPPPLLPEPEPELPVALEPELTPEPEPLPPAVLAAQIMASRNLEIAELTARIHQKSTAYSKRERRKAISASTREYKFANYLEAWRRKVERIGNLNYPDEARRHKMYGSLILHVAVRVDGSIEQVRVLRSSGFEVLDASAVRIVELAAPFAPFPPDISADVDVLDITRTWQFLSSNRLGWGN